MTTEWHEQIWEVVVVGTGMGGATLGFALAAQGRRVLFIERGHDLMRRAPAPLAPVGADDEAPQARMARGHWPTRLHGQTNRGAVDVLPSLGCGTGGSTLLYAAQLERLFAADFEPRGHFADLNGSTLPEAWPVSHAEMLPWYRQAERLFRVCGSADPLDPDAATTLREPPPMSARDVHFMRSFRELGLKAYQAHVACDFIDDCVGCGGRICEHGCKSDARRACLEPALREHGATLVADCEAVAVEADAQRAHGVRVHWQGRELLVRAELVVLAAGALMTPRILLASTSAHWPEGLANRSGAVGRNLMFHATDFAAVRPRLPQPGVGPQKAVATNDFYLDAGGKLGAFQSIGITLEPGMVYAQLLERMPRLPRVLRLPVRALLHLAAAAIGRTLRGSTLFATITEDLPYWHNRVLRDEAAPGGVRFEYRYSAELDRRARRFRDLLSRKLRTHHRLRWLSFRHNLNFGHACGTCRFGDDPATSVLDRDNRAHGIDNLYVVDASFFPSSGGTNPSLTIAANALRVAQAIGARFASASDEPLAQQA
ncbi:MAG TPA: GMC family oxidoreductase [Methylibium sp.]|uniref:GMC family oxidoreductase n=1 Tax=Methylibium sp. TaxID=2067992 RepID=UPI002DBA8138|nr:GMC family oxidoreductase [Methylibium sp.]HEU4458204.1 GMC family oxidoreductase [Methylibium sp.]